MSKDNSNTSDQPKEVTTPEKGVDNVTPTTSRDNKLLEKQRLMAGQDFSMTKVDQSEIKKASEAQSSAFQLVDGHSVVAASKKASDKAAPVGEKHAMAIQPGEIQVDQGVSPRRKAEVEHWLQTVPDHLRQALLASHCKCRIIVNVNLSPDLAKEASEAARGQNHTIDQLPMFYSPSKNAIIFVDRASRTVQEQKVEAKVNASIDYQRRNGLQSYGDGKENLNNFDVKSLTYAGIERNGWHEMGHAIDQAVLKKFSARHDFDAAFQEGAKSLNTEERHRLNYFLTNKDELFAEIFAIKHVPDPKKQVSDEIILKHFSKLIKLMHDQAQVKDSSGTKHPLF
ncbi:MAG: hypothetical protein JSS83_02840 [Cyanobacteria bacterium SZAS LIN-3]|nr:hypothetical protein [Cyanobacteria bacterium SZAS LIN-3]